MASTFNLPLTNDWAVSAQIHSDSGCWQNHSETNYQTLPVDKLLQQCGENSADYAWMEFIQRFNPLIASIIRRTCREWTGTAPDVVEDLIQETYLKLCANSYSLLANFHSRHPNAFLGCIKTVATNVVYDYFRSARAFKRDIGKNVELDHAIHYLHEGDGEAEWLENKVLLSQIDQLLQQRGDAPAAEKNREIFWLYYREGLTAKAIALMPGTGMTTKGVEGIIARLTKFVKKSLARDPRRRSITAFGN
ncbi:MAG TPA: sigma-70 family RNA polymerase sigma factor [Candidatus Angelobacter sp.]|jgi:RNA polymerase sigma-70 factor (ECF subfamily)|nr:sigma-70 family RNA polymerase sigma factor [Candidatus Angelobacter sp.]